MAADSGRDFLISDKLIQCIVEKQVSESLEGILHYFDPFTEKKITCSNLEATRLVIVEKMSFACNKFCDNMKERINNEVLQRNFIDR